MNELEKLIELSKNDPSLQGEVCAKLLVSPIYVVTPAVPDGGGERERLIEESETISVLKL